MELSAVPDELLMQVLQYLSTVELLGVRRVCRRWRDVALHPFLWRTRCLDQDDGEDLTRAVLSLAPCAGSVDLWGELLEDVSDLSVLAANTRCAIKRLELWMDENSNVLVGALAIRNQAALGRLRELKIIYWDHQNNSNVFHHLHSLVCCIEGLEELQVAGKYTVISCEVLFLDVCPSLKNLDYDIDRWDPYVDHLVRVHAPTLERLTLGSKQIPLHLLAGASQLQFIKCQLQEDMALIPASNLTEVVIEVAYDDVAWGVRAVRRGKAFLRAASKLKSLMVIYAKVPEDAELELSAGLAAPGRTSCIEELDISVRRTDPPLPPLPLQPLMDTLPFLPHLRSLHIHYVVPDEFLDAITQESAPSLRRLEIGVEVICLHEWVHQPRVMALMARKPRMHLHVVSQGAAQNCEFCKGNNCHRELIEALGDHDTLRYKTFNFFVHPESDTCGDHVETSWQPLFRI